MSEMNRPHGPPAADDESTQLSGHEPARTEGARDVLPPERRRRLPRPPKNAVIVTCVLLGVVSLGVAGVSYAAYEYSKKYEGRILPGAMVAGVDVGGMTPEQALRAVKGEIRPQLRRKIEVVWKGKSWTATAKELGARSNARAAVDAAVAASGEATFFDKVQMRVFGDEMDHIGDVAIHYSRKEPKGFIVGLASGLHRDVRNASLDYSSGWVEITPERAGRDVVVDKSLTKLMSTLRSSRRKAELVVEFTKPDVTRAAYDDVLLLRIGENKLYLYENGKITHTYVVATGQPEYPTPTGLYEIIEKRYMPTWVNPDPTGWGSDMPAQIPPGPGNPLGLRALRWSEPTINFHGTTATYSLGYNASHGCIRLSNPEIIELYDLVDVGTPIVSIEVGSMKPQYSDSADPIVTPGDDHAEG